MVSSGRSVASAKTVRSRGLLGNAGSTRRVFGFSPGSAELPGGAVRGVGDLDASGVEFFPDLVGAGPVVFLAGLGAFGDELLDVVPFLIRQVLGRAAGFQVGRVE